MLKSLILGEKRSLSSRGLDVFHRKPIQRVTIARSPEGWKLLRLSQHDCVVEHHAQELKRVSHDNRQCRKKIHASRITTVNVINTAFLQLTAKRDGIYFVKTHYIINF